MANKKTPLIALTLLLLAVLIVMTFVRHCKPQAKLTSELPTEQTVGDTLNVALMYSPSIYYKYGDSVSGLSYEMLRRMSKDLNLPMRFYPVSNLEESLEGVEKGNYRILAALPSNQALKERFAMTDDVARDRQVLVQRVVSGAEGDSLAVRTALDLAGKEVNIVKDSPAQSRLEHLQRETGSDIKITPQADLSEEYLVMKVASGEMDYAVVNEITARHMSKEFSNVNYDTPISFTQFQSWALAPGDTLLQRRINSWLRDFKGSQDYEQWLEKYQ